MYSEKSRIPWGALVVAAAVLIFGCIMIGALIIMFIIITVTI